jgi:PAS domain S-box-containing protein
MKDKPVILIVDDEPQNIELLEAYLVPQGYEIVKAANGEEALGKLSDNQIDLILLDVKMPGMDGFEVTRRVRQDNTHRLLPIILVTVLREMEDRVKGIEAGCNDFISYPVDKIELLARVRSLLKVKAYNDLMTNYRKELESGVTKKTEELKHALENLQQDVTERREMEENIKKLSLRQQALLAAIPDIIMEVDTHKIYTWANKAGIEFFGDDVIGKEADFYFVREQNIYDIVQPIFDGNKDIIYVESWQKRKDGKERLLAWWCHMLKDAQGNVTGALSSGRDITDQKKLEDLVEKEREELKLIIDSSPIIVFYKDREGRFIRINKTFAEVLDRPEENFVGKTVFDLYSPRTAQNMADNDQDVFQSRRPKLNIVEQYESASGTRWAQTDKIPILDKDGMPIGLIGFAQDITERKLAEKEIKRLNEELEQRVIERTTQMEAINKELETFSYSVSHDLRAPLRSIDGFSHALLQDYQGKLDATGKNYLERICKATQHMGDLIDDLLKLSRVTQSEFNYQSIDLSKMVQSISDTFQKNNPNNNVKMTIQKGIVIQGDPHSMQIALTNLIDNAWKFTGKQKHPRIEFGATLKENEKIFFIRDNGVGFDMSYVGKLFGAFQRLHTMDEFVGTGIGLATVQRIIRRHGGKIWAEGKVGKGATFYFTLPA